MDYIDRPKNTQVRKDTVEHPLVLRLQKELRRRLRSNTVRDLAKELHVPHEWLYQYARGDIANPNVHRVLFIYERLFKTKVA